MVSTTLAIARNAFVEAIRQPVYLGLILLSGVLQLFNTWATGFSMGYRNTPGEVTGDNKLLFDIGLATVFGAGLLLAAFTSTSVISREIENKTILTVVSKPIGRARVVIGKYLGVAGAMVLAIVIMLVFLLLGIRHGVLSTAADTLDWPVILFGVGAVFLALLLGTITNYLYGWSFPQTSVVAMLPLTLISYTLVLAVSKKWEFQGLGTDFKPQITLACIAIGMALLVIAAIATAVSTRVGQVMTIVICAGVFVLGLLSNFFIGRYAYENHAIGVVANMQSGSELNLRTVLETRILDLAAKRAGVTPEEFQADRMSRTTDYVTKWEVLRMAMQNADDPVISELLMRTVGSEYTLALEAAPREPVEVGDTIYYGPAPNGVALVPPVFDRPSPETDLEADVYASGTPSALVAVWAEGPFITVRNIGAEPLALWRPPLEGDFVFKTPTRIHPIATAAWAVVPNMQAFWLVDAITQAKPIPASHILLVGLYSLSQISLYLAVGVILFQGRDVG